MVWGGTWFRSVHIIVWEGIIFRSVHIMTWGGIRFRSSISWYGEVLGSGVSYHGMGWY